MLIICLRHITLGAVNTIYVYKDWQRMFRFELHDRVSFRVNENGVEI